MINMAVVDHRTPSSRMIPPHSCPKGTRKHLQRACFALGLHSLTVAVGEVRFECANIPNSISVEILSSHRNQVAWTARIAHYNKHGQCREALQVYEDLLRTGFRPGSYIFVAVLKACSALQDLECARRIHAEVVKRGLEEELHVGTMLVDVYAKCGSFVEARGVFERMPKRNVVSWTALMSGHVQVGDCEVALQLYARMQQEGVVPNDRTFICALKACSKLARKEEKHCGKIAAQKRVLEQVMAIHMDVMKGEFRSDAFVASMLLDVYVKCGSLMNARRVFEQMTHHDVVSWTAMILGYVHSQEAEEALQLYEQMLQKGVVPDGRAFLGALKAVSSLADSEGSRHDKECVKERCLRKVKVIHSQILERKLESNEFLGTMLIDVYAKCGSLEDGKRIFERLARRDVVCWTAMILGYAQANLGEEALSLYARMQYEGVAPDERTFVGALKACGCVAALDKGKDIHARVSRTGLGATDLILGNSLVDMYGKCGSMVDAQQVFDRMQAKDVVTWSALIAGYASLGDSQTAFALFHRMTEDEIQPNAITFLSILAVCSHMGLVDKGQHYFEAMKKEFNITPAIEHYTCMMDLLGRAGQVQAAMMIATTMPFEPDGAVWESLLGACQKWGEVDIARQAYVRAMRLDETSSAR